MSDRLEKAILAGGCFWGMQDLFRKQPGVVSTRVGYSGGDVPNATYRNHGTHAEAIEVVFDPDETSYRAVLEFFFRVHDPTTVNRQGNDIGASYRSAIFYVDDEQRQIAADTVADVEASGRWPGKVVTEVAPAGDICEPKVRDRRFGEQRSCGPLDSASAVRVHLPPERGGTLVCLRRLLDDERKVGGAAVDPAEMCGVQLEHRNRVGSGLHFGGHFPAADREGIDVAANGIVDGGLQDQRLRPEQRLHGALGNTGPLPDRRHRRAGPAVSLEGLLRSFRDQQTSAQRRVLSKRRAVMARRPMHLPRHGLGYHLIQ